MKDVPSFEVIPSYEAEKVTEVIKYKKLLN